MRIKVYDLIIVGLLSFVSMLGCSRKPAEPPGTGVQSDAKATTILKQSAGTSEEEAKKQALANNDGPIDDIFNQNRGRALPDAREWAKRNSKTFPGDVTLEAVLTSLSDAGAQRINVLTNWPSCDYLIILTLPSEAGPRQKVFASDSRLRKMCGIEETKDFGQKYLFYPFVNSMFKPTTAN